MFFFFCMLLAQYFQRGPVFFFWSDLFLSLSLFCLCGQDEHRAKIGKRRSFLVFCWFAIVGGFFVVFFVKADPRSWNTN